jgi:hypothetical protein
MTTEAATIVAYRLVDNHSNRVLRTVPVPSEEKRMSIRRRLTATAERKCQAYGSYRYSVQPVFAAAEVVS